MSLQTRLLYLLLAFVVFALAATSATIYSVHLHVGDALRGLHQTLDTGLRLDRLRNDVRRVRLTLEQAQPELIARDSTIHDDIEALLRHLRQTSRLLASEDQQQAAETLLAAEIRFSETFEPLLDPALEPPQRALPPRSEWGPALTALESDLRQMRADAERRSAVSVDVVVTSEAQILLVALLVAVVGVGLAVLGALLFRRWIVLPLGRLRAATEVYRAGRLDHRVEIAGRDELATLAQSMNEMAADLSAAQAAVRESEAKYRTLFQNLRDTALICDADGCVIEAHAGQGMPRTLAQACTPGQSLAEVWRSLGFPELDWTDVLGKPLVAGEQVRITDLLLPTDNGAAAAVHCELLAYSVDYAGRRAVAIVLRDVSEQRRFERAARRGEAMQATITLARGVAHDFSGLLSAAVASLSALRSELGRSDLATYVDRALRSCGQAVGLSRTLLSFAGSDPGTPETLNLAETVRLILDSLDDEVLRDVEVDASLDDTVHVTVDRDQLTQIVLNLVRNACEAMGGAGSLRIVVRATRLDNAAGAQPTHALLEVTDNGPGIPREARERLFEPFFSTKSGIGRQTRGLGLAVVYAAVKTANGAVDVSSRPDHGTTFRVRLPLARADLPR